MLMDASVWSRAGGEGEWDGEVGGLPAVRRAQGGVEDEMAVDTALFEKNLDGQRQIPRVLEVDFGHQHCVALPHTTKVEKNPRPEHGSGERYVGPATADVGEDPRRQV
jgi:hypothetical protein